MILKKYRFIKYIKVLTTVGLLFAIVYLYDYQETKIILQDADGRYVFIALLLQFGILLFNAIRWQIILHYDNCLCSLGKLFKVTLIANFANNFMPTSIGGDAIRSIYIYRKNHKSSSVASVIFERILGLIVMVVIGFIAILLSSNTFLSINNIFISKDIYEWLLLLVLIISVGYVLLRYDSEKIFFIKKIIKKTTMIFRNVGYRVICYITNFRLLSSVLVLTVCSQFIGILMYWNIGISVGIDIPLGIYFVILPITLIVSSLPISFGGLGLRELTSILLFTKFGVLESVAVSVSVIYYFILIISGIPGMVWYLLEKKSIEKTGS